MADAFAGLGESRTRFIQPSENSAVFATIERFGNIFVNAAKRNLAQAGANASGALSASIAFKVTIMGQRYRFQILAEDYWVFVDGGRGRTKAGGGGAVRKSIGGQQGWISLKGLPVVAIMRKITGRTMSTKEANKALTFLITRKIHKKGFKGNKFMTSVLNPRSMEKFRAEISRSLRRDVELEIQDLQNFVIS